MTDAEHADALLTIFDAWDAYLETDRTDIGDLAAAIGAARATVALTQIEPDD